MASKDALNCLAKRDLLNQPVVSVEDLLAWGQQFAAAGLLHDAVDFYEKANATEALLGLLQVVQEQGDTFLFKRINRILKREPEREEWLALAAKAESLGKNTFVAEALQQVEPEESGQ
jgi:hypothetical protein